MAKLLVVLGIISAILAMVGGSSINSCRDQQDHCQPRLFHELVTRPPNFRWRAGRLVALVVIQRTARSADIIRARTPAPDASL